MPCGYQVDELPSATMTLAAEEEAVSFLEKLAAVPEPTMEAGADPKGSQGIPRDAGRGMSDKAPCDDLSALVYVCLRTFPDVPTFYFQCSFLSRVTLNVGR